MADTVTTKHGLVKPEVGASDDTWGDKINADLDQIDDLLDVRSTTAEVLAGTAANRTVTPDALAALWEKAANEASAATVELGTGTPDAGGGYFEITGTTNISAINFRTPKDGRRAMLYFQGALTIIHSATLVCPGAVDLEVAAGDIVEVIQHTSTIRRVYAVNKAAASYRYVGTDILTSGTSYNVPSGTDMIDVEAQAGGGGGGGADTNGTDTACAPGGGGGGYGRKRIFNPAASYAYAIGAAGSGGAAGANNGGAGGSTTFGTAGSELSLGGGGGGQGIAAGAGALIAGGGVGGVVTTGGDYSVSGHGGWPTYRAGGHVRLTGAGGDSVLGMGGGAGGSLVSTTGAVGQAGSGYGAGGSGGLAGTGGDQAGGNGTQGAIFVHRYVRVG